MAEEESTEVLVSRARQGDRAAFDRIATRYTRPLLDSIRAHFRAQEGALCDPEDILAETLLRAFEDLATFEWKGEDSFSRWLFGISRNVRLHEMRRMRSKLSLEAVESIPSKDPSPSRALGREERLERLERAIADLPPEYREVVRLSRIDGLKTKEVAARLGKSADAVKHLLSRAIQALRGKLDETESLHLPDRRLGEKP